MAIIAYLLQQLHNTQHVAELRRCLATIPTDIPQVDVGRSMGLPTNWRDEELWRLGDMTTPES